MTGTWERHGGETLLHRSRLNVHSDQTTSPGGDQFTYDWIEAADQVRIAALADEHVWIIDQHHYLPGTRLWQLPGGTVDAGENTRQAAQRELVEETGIEAAHWHAVGTFWPLPGLTTLRVHLWIATGLTAGIAYPESGEADLITRREPLSHACAAVIDGRVGCSASAQLIFMAERYLTLDERALESLGSMSFVRDLGMRVRTVRMDLGWSQDRLAESTGFAQAQLSRWEMGERSMTVEQLVIIADAMGLEAATLLPGSALPQPSVAIVAEKLVAQLRDAANLVEAYLTGDPDTTTSSPDAPSPLKETPVPPD